MSGKPIECPIKYIVVEAIRSDEKNLISTSIELGLFQGILQKKLHKTSPEAENFVLMKGKDDILKTLCLTYYNILSLERFDGTTKVVTFFRATKEDQEKAMVMGRDLVEQMRKGNRTMAAEDAMIDVTTYSEVPAVMGATKTETLKGTTYSRFQSKSTLGQGAGVIHHHKAVKKPLVPTLFKRKGKKPTKTALDAMDAKILLIAQGEYNPILPEIKGDAEEKANPLAYNEDEYNASFFHHQ